MTQAPAVSMRLTAERSRVAFFAPRAADVSEAALVSKALPAAMIHAPARERMTPSPEALGVTVGATVNGAALRPRLTPRSYRAAGPLSRSVDLIRTPSRPFAARARD